MRLYNCFKRNTWINLNFILAINSNKKFFKFRNLDVKLTRSKI